jgi:hypothetical protein
VKIKTTGPKTPLQELREMSDNEIMARLCHLMPEKYTPTGLPAGALRILRKLEKEDPLRF